ncbi:hypothetical protein [Shewanella sp. Isolate11]|uniref:hypothetical protein n=1 Tax=Shewanella sp. Isolate11 TaxID=2908530 RepID=UPI001EFC465E|nr:hypothetical protein [Shewanella sp. Isolate11]MCG9695712.1 hypothetical protein [Shewanella sp. Isolate11]
MTCRQPQKPRNGIEETVSQSSNKSNNTIQLVHAIPHSEEVHHLWHFSLTLLTFGLWGIVWWRIIIKSQGEDSQFFDGFDDAYWSHLIEREQPPAALYTIQFDAKQRSAQFDA